MSSIGYKSLKFRPPQQTPIPSIAVQSWDHLFIRSRNRAVFQVAGQIGVDQDEIVLQFAGANQLFNYLQQVVLSFGCRDPRTHYRGTQNRKTRCPHIHPKAPIQGERLSVLGNSFRLTNLMLWSSFPLEGRKLIVRLTVVRQPARISSLRDGRRRTSEWKWGIMKPRG